MRATAKRMSRPTLELVKERLMCSTWWREPATTNAMPRTKSRLVSTEPRRDSWMRRWYSWNRAVPAGSGGSRRHA